MRRNCISLLKFSLMNYHRGKFITVRSRILCLWKSVSDSPVSGKSIYLGKGFREKCTLTTNFFFNNIEKVYYFVLLLEKQSLAPQRISGGYTSSSVLGGGRRGLGLCPCPALAKPHKLYCWSQDVSGSSCWLPGDPAPNSHLKILPHVPTTRVQTCTGKQMPRRLSSVTLPHI